MHKKMETLYTLYMEINKQLNRQPKAKDDAEIETSTQNITHQKYSLSFQNVNLVLCCVSFALLSSTV